MQVSILGTVELRTERGILPLRGQHQRALLAWLALAEGQVVSTEQLADVLWGDSPPECARNKVQACVSELRKLVRAVAGDGPDASGEWLVTRLPGYQLATDRVSVDYLEYTQRVNCAYEAMKAGTPALASQQFGAALRVHRGAACSDVRSEMVRAAARLIADRRMLVVEAKADADLLLGDDGAVISEVTRELEADPYRERLCAQLMLAYYRRGCRATALGLYRRARERLVAELGIGPGPELQQLHQLVLSDSRLLRDPRLLDHLASRASVPGVPQQRAGLATASERPSGQ
jgi:DNA-binding SARP family transcriptional activator